MNANPDNIAGCYRILRDTIAPALQKILAAIDRAPVQQSLPGLVAPSDTADAPAGMEWSNPAPKGESRARRKRHRRDPSALVAFRIITHNRLAGERFTFAAAVDECKDGLPKATHGRVNLESLPHLLGILGRAGMITQERDDRGAILYRIETTEIDADARARIEAASAKRKAAAMLKEGGKEEE